MDGGSRKSQPDGYRDRKRTYSEASSFLQISLDKHHADGRPDGERSRSPNRRDNRSERRRSRSPLRDDQQKSSMPMKSERHHGDAQRGKHHSSEASHSRRSHHMEKQAGAKPGGAGKSREDAYAMEVDNIEKDMYDLTADDIFSVMRFSQFRTTKNTKVPGNDKNWGVNKNKTTQYRQYMNRTGGFNRPLSPGR